MKTTRESGSALLLATVAFLLMAGIGAALFSLALAGDRSSRAATEADAAYHLAEAGIDDAINKLRAYQEHPEDTDADYSVIGEVAVGEAGQKVNEITGELEGGGYTVTIEPPFDGAGEYKITSVGEAYGEKRGIVTWVVAAGGEGGSVPTVFQYGLFGVSLLDAAGNIKADGYDSSKGTYASQAINKVNGNTFAKMTGHVGSNGAVAVSGNAAIYGNATPGPKNIVTSKGNAKVYGSTAPAKAPLVLPPTDYVAPAGATSIAAITATKTLAGGTYKVPSIKASGKTVLTINGDVTLYVSGDIDFTGNTSLQINPGASLTIYQSSATSDLKLAGNTMSNTSLSPQDLQIFTNAKTAKLTGNSDFYGAFYAPNTAVSIQGNAAVFGAVVGKTVDIQGNFAFHYDESLGMTTSSAAAGAVSLTVKSFEQFVP